ncbi:hypothetical protein [Actinomadura sp. GTD37]|uniref:hypothetical protein n=1 Tax=Actinomadura sp. GTD37 TaxID=1778030 RepID=UPI0035BFC598
MVGAVVNVATGMLTQEWGLAWLAAAVACVAVGAGLLAWLTFRAAADSEPPRRVSASGDGSIAAEGSVTGSSTKVARPAAGSPAAAPPGEGVSASGLGAIAAGGDVEDSRTEVTGDDQATP